MSRYRYTLSDYHAVNDADILIDGITVLSGENGCGKSTLSRWLYYLINGSQRLDEFIFDEFVSTINERLSRLDRVSIEINRSISISQTDFDIDSLSALRQTLYKFRSKDYYSEQDISSVSDNYKDLVNDFSQILGKYLEVVPKNARRERVLSYLDVLDTDSKDNGGIIDEFTRKYYWILQRAIERFDNQKGKRGVSFLMNAIKDHFEETDESPKNIQLYEDDVDLLTEDGVSTLFNLQRAIYVDTPMALTESFTDNIFWDELRSYILRDGKTDDSVNKKILLRIKNIIHGEAKLGEDESVYGDNELRYISSDKLINIEIEKTATGFKTFTYLQRLLENGLLNSETLLLIDEPEAHLHPQWIVEYARLLVLMSKDLGLKVMLASHNPDMVAAIRSIAEKEGMMNKTHFYLAKQSDKPNQYVYKDLNGEIAEIFESFNIALSRIEAYGTRDI